MNMLKLLLKLSVYIIIIFIINVIFIKAPANIVSTFDLLFLNFDKFYIYHLSKINFQYIICFCLYNNIVIYYILSEISESNTFLSMMVFRVGVIKTYILLLKKDIKKIILIFLTSFLTLILMTFIYAKFNIEYFKFIEFILCFLFLLKYHLWLMIFVCIYNFLAICGKNLKGLYVVNAIFIILLLADMFLGLNIITFSSNIVYELKTLLVLIILLFVIFCSNVIVFKKKGDVL